MSSLLTSMARSVSDEVKAYSAVKRTMSAVPSFNDFSLHTPQDAEMEYESYRTRRNRSDSFQDFKDAEKYDGQKTPGLSASFSLPLRTPWDVLSRSELQSSSVPNNTLSTGEKRQRHKDRKIGGMDMYEYCELIRSL